MCASLSVPFANSHYVSVPYLASTSLSQKTWWLSGNLTGTVKGAMMWHIHIQAYTYKHTHTTMQWCAPQVCDAFPWKVVQTHNAQVFALHSFVFTIRSCCWQHCLWIYSKQTWTHTYAITVDYTLLLLLYGLVIVMITSYVHCHTIIQIQSYTYNHAMVLHASKWNRALESIIYIQCASAHGVYLGVDVLIPAGNRIIYRSSASYQHELIQTQSCWMTRCY